MHTVQNKDGSLTNRRLLSPIRDQFEFHYGCLDELITEDHPARRIWDYVQTLDLSKFLERIKSVEGNVGRPAIDPKILLALWLYAIIEGIGSAWLLGEYCQQHIGFRWICGNVPVDRKTLSNFRVNYAEEFEELLTESVALLAHAGHVELKELSQDGLKTRASAGRTSFYREKKLREFMEITKERVKILKQELENDPSSNRNRLKTTCLAKARDRLEKLKSSIKELQAYREEKDRNRKKNRKRGLSEKEKAEMRVSKTDPEARIMKMADDGFRPAYNVQFAVDTPSQVIVSADVSNMGNDSCLMLQMFNKIKKAYQKTPERYLVDPGFKNIEDIITMEKQGCQIYSPTENSKGAQTRRINTEKQTNLHILAWIDRMNTAEGKKVYRNRAKSVECVNAQARNRGLYQFIVRGLKKARGVVMLMALAHNMTRAFAFKMA